MAQHTKPASAPAALRPDPLGAQTMMQHFVQRPAQEQAHQKAMLRNELVERPAKK